MLGQQATLGQFSAPVCRYRVAATWGVMKVRPAVLLMRGSDFSQRSAGYCGPKPGDARGQTGVSLPVPPSNLTILHARRRTPD